MKKLVFLLSIFCTVYIGALHADVTKTVGATGADYATLKAAFDAINSGAINTGVITLQIIDNTTETASAVLNASGTGSSSYSSVVIYPTVTGKSISGSFTAALIDLDGADNVTFDGRLNQIGSTPDLTITQSESTNNSSRTIRIWDDANNNTIRYCTIKGSCPSTGAGVIFLSTSASGTTGCDNTTIEYNNITNAGGNRPLYAINSTGTSSKDNDNLIIRYNSIYDIFRSTTNGGGILLSTATNGSTITGNSFYETASFAPSGATTFTAISISNTSGNNFSVTNNYIGGSAAQCGGTWTKTNANTNAFTGIAISVGTTTATNVQGNIIKGFKWDNASNTTFYGINVTGGAVNIGTTAGNTIGAITGGGTSGTASISSFGCTVEGILISSTGTVNCQNNLIGSIWTDFTSTSATGISILGIDKSGAGTTTISNNMIGSTGSANNIYAACVTTFQFQTSKVIGIRSSGSGTVTVSGNSIANLTNGTTNTDASTNSTVHGIECTAGTNTIQKNTVFNLTIAAASPGKNSSTSACGIVMSYTTAAVQLVKGNTVYGISNSYNGFTGGVYGIYYNGSSTVGTVSENFIRDITAPSAGTTAIISGIYQDAGSANFYNNVIYLNPSTVALVYGLQEKGTTNNVYFNTVVVGGTATASSTTNSASFYSPSSTTTRDIRNNIFLNTRSNPGSETAKHYAAWFSNAAIPANIDYNDYKVSGTGGVIGRITTSDKTSLPLFTGKDAASVTTDPSITVGSTAINFSGSQALTGTAITNYTTDYLATTRGGTPKIGAFEPSSTPGAATVTAFSSNNSPAGSSVSITGTNFYNVTGVTFGGAAASSYTVNSGTQITAVIGAGSTGSVAVTNGAGTGSLSGFTFVKANQTITFAAPSKTYGDADFAPATASSGLTVTYASSNTAVATIVSGQIHVVGVGTSTITASQAGDASYNAASDVQQTLTVGAKVLTITGISIGNKTYDGNTAATISGTAAYSGLVNSESFTVTGTPSAAFATAAAGTAKSVTVSGYTAPNSNYSITQPTGLTADIAKAELLITADNKVVSEGIPTIDVTNAGTYTPSGFVNSETASVITGSVAYSTNYTPSTPRAAAGIYISPDVSGLSATNYYFTPVNGVITVDYNVAINPKKDASAFRVISSQQGLKIVLDEPSVVEIFNANGVLIDKSFRAGVFSPSLSKGIYIIKVKDRVARVVR